ncbi:MAG: hypothetical protein KJ583_07425 [Nanoarchaeota archaeon]|nr:hypothetical protein [Nanoarchaeota archaeon]MBU1269739.1 hypothetical protein [Nanoarchaeota archaeon]MBU1605118.1 hypothetical protein [Nanoarchaeota archaeon]
MKFILKPKAPFDFDLLWKFYAWGKPSPEIYENGVWRRALNLDSKLFPVKIKSVGTTGKPKLEVEILSEISKAEIKKLKEKIQWIFNSQMDLKELYSFLDKDKKLKTLLKKLYGLKPANYATVFEGVVKTIIQQQISLIGSMHITSRLISEFGEKTEVAKECFYEFPSPEALARVPSAKLKQCGLSRQKTTYIKEFSRSIAENNGFNPEEVVILPVSNGIEKLNKIKGVGQWTAELVIVTCTDHKELLPAGDLGVRRAISNFYSKDLMTEEEIRKFTEKWGKHKALIAYYLICNERSDFKLNKKGGK